MASMLTLVGLVAGWVFRSARTRNNTNSHEAVHPQAPFLSATPCSRHWLMSEVGQPLACNSKLPVGEQGVPGVAHDQCFHSQVESA